MRHRCLKNQCLLLQAADGGFGLDPPYSFTKYSNGGGKAASPHPAGRPAGTARADDTLLCRVAKSVHLWAACLLVLTACPT